MPHPQTLPTKEPRLWRERCFASEILQAVRADECFLHQDIDWNFFFLYRHVVLFTSQESERNPMPPDRGWACTVLLDFWKGPE